MCIRDRFIANHSEDGDGFEEYAKYDNEKNNGKKNDNYALLSVLRMDVDNLGAVFLYGLKDIPGGINYYSLARSVAVSRLFNLFFTVKVNYLAEKYKLYVTYSGGDDLFIVGSWINILKFAPELRKSFAEFACGNNNLTLSAGIHLCKPKYPIGKGAEKAGKAEENAKGYIFEQSNSEELQKGAVDSPVMNKYNKDSISIFGRVYKWKELDDMLEYAANIQKLIEKGKINASYMHFLLNMFEKIFDSDKKMKINEFFKYLPKIKYSFARKGINQNAIDRSINDTNENNVVKTLSKLIAGNYWQYYMQNFRIVAYYTILKNRKTKYQEEQNGR
ncbi:MAG: hypothetical protein IAE91_07260, partial [Ignavibacteriaceae bacterium]|nr:hypothetical protein [Ignavibacteriaceae bacterium]